MEEQGIAAKPEELIVEPAIQEMLDAGVFFGRKTSRTHPRMKPYTVSSRNGMEIINIEKTKEDLDKALEFVAGVVKNGGSLLFVATQAPAVGAVQLAREMGFPVVDRRWLGGTLTNSKIILGRLDYYKKLKSDFEKGALEKYTKKERVKIEKELAKLAETMSGLESFARLPNALVTIDSDLHRTAVREARHLGIPIVAFVNTDSDPDLVDYPVVGNNKALTSISWFLEKLRGTLSVAQAAAGAAKAAADSEVEKKNGGQK